MNRSSVRKRITLKNIALGAMRFLGVYSLSRLITRRYPRIIMFHKIYADGDADQYSDYTTISRFKEIVDYLAKHYRFYTLRELIGYFVERGHYPKNAVVITFDDGFRSFYDYAFPILQQYDACATVFVCPKLIEEETTIWPEIVFDAFESSALTLEEGDDVLSFVERLKLLTSEQRYAEMQRCISVSYRQSERNFHSNNRRLLDWQDIQHMLLSRLIEIGSHSLSHPILSLEDDVVVEREISQSKQMIETMTGQSVESFCYPNGQEDDYRQRDFETLQASGYSSAVTARFGLPDAACNRYALPRFGGDFKSFLQARKYIDGVELMQRKLLKQ